MYIVANAYSNENIGEFDNFSVISKTFRRQEDAVAFVESVLKEDVDNSVYKAEEMIFLKDVSEVPIYDDNIVHVAGWTLDGIQWDRFHNAYFVIEADDPV
jgi:hypothetical protein